MRETGCMKILHEYQHFCRKFGCTFWNIWNRCILVQNHDGIQWTTRNLVFIDIRSATSGHGCSSRKVTFGHFFERKNFPDNFMLTLRIWALRSNGVKTSFGARITLFMTFQIIEKLLKNNSTFGSSSWRGIINELTRPWFEPVYWLIEAWRFLQLLNEGSLV